jgi:fatty acid desaturase
LKLLPSRRRERPTANIGVHHVHHLCSRIPYYRLPRALRDHPELRGVGRLTLVQSFRCVRPVPDEAQNRLVSFGDIRSNGRVCSDLVSARIVGAKRRD